MFEHHVMAKASNRILNPSLFPFNGEDPAVVRKLKAVGQTFGQLQDKRHIADYDNSTFWTRTEALGEVRKAVLAFSTWNSIKDEKIAQAYLVSLLIKPRN